MAGSLNILHDAVQGRRDGRIDIIVVLIILRLVAAAKHISRLLGLELVAACTASSGGYVGFAACQYVNTEKSSLPVCTTG